MNALCEIRLEVTRDAFPSRHVPAAVRPLVAVLGQLAELLAGLGAAQYTAALAGAMSSSIGKHVRHNLDHVDALLAGLDRGRVDYDQRRRGTEIETCPQAAVAAIRRQERQLLALDAAIEGKPLRLSVLLCSSGPPVEVTTTVGRELAFVLSHTIHHHALIAILADALGISLPRYFGYAPATIVHREAQACVR